LPDLHWRGGARLRHEHGAVAHDRDGRSVGRHGDCRLNNEAAGGDHLAMTNDLERTIAGIAGGPIRQRHLKEAIALDGQILVVSGLLQILGLNDLGLCDGPINLKILKAAAQEDGIKPEDFGEFEAALVRFGMASQRNALLEKP
jgi:hypothetical protein